MFTNSIWSYLLLYIFLVPRNSIVSLADWYDTAAVRAVSGSACFLAYRDAFELYTACYVTSSHDKGSRGSEVSIM